MNFGNISIKIHKLILIYKPVLYPQLQNLKQGIHAACRGWAQAIKQQSNKNITQTSSSATVTTSPNNIILTTNNNDQEQPSAVVRASTMVDHVQRLFGREFVITHSHHSLVSANKQQQDGLETFIVNDTTVRRCMTVQNPRLNVNSKETCIEMDSDHNDSTSNRDHRRASGFLDKICLFNFLFG